MVGRRPFERRDHHDDAVANVELNADPRILPVELLVHPLGTLRSQEHRVRIERLEHPVDRSAHQLLVVRRLDVVVLNQVEHLGEDVELAAEVIGRHQPARQAKAQQQRQRHGHQNGAARSTTRRFHALGVLWVRSYRAGLRAFSRPSRSAAASSVSRRRAKWKRSR